MYLNRGVLLTIVVSGFILADSVASTPKPPRAAVGSRDAAGAGAVSKSSVAAPLQSAAGFNQHVAPLLARVCSHCHNEQLAAGGLNILNFTDPRSLTENREAWETIVRQVRGGEMPPRGVPRPSPV